MKLTFIPSDFVNLSNPIMKDEEWIPTSTPNDSTRQYNRPFDCPVYRCCKRQGYLDEKDWPMVDYDLYMRGVDKLNEIRERLLSGETEVTIEI